MSKRKSDEQLLESMSRHRSPSAVSQELASSMFGQLVAESTAPTILQVSQIRKSPYQSKGAVDDAHIEKLMESISEHGLWNPVIVRPVSESDTPYELLAGENRWEAFRRLGRGEIPAKIIVADDRMAAIILTAENTHHHQLTDWQKFKHLDMLRSKHGVQEVTLLAKILNCSRAQIYNLEAFGFLPKPVQLSLDQMPDLIGGTMAYELRKFSEEVPNLVQEAIELVETKKLKQSGVVQWIERRVAGLGSGGQETTRREVQYSKNGKDFKLVINSRGVHLSGALNVDKLTELVEANLDLLTR